MDILVTKTKRKEDAMVKGISRRIVVVRPPDASVFDEAIFVVRECMCVGGDLSETAEDLAIPP